MRYEDHRICKDVHNGLITQVAFNVDGKLLASAGLDGKLCIWEVASGELRYQYFTGHDVLSLVWVDSVSVVCGLSDGTISCLAINLEKKTLDVAGMWGHSYPVEALAMAKSRLASGAHKELFIWRWNYNVPMSYQERELSVPASPDMDLQVDDEVLITGVDWSGKNGDGQPSLLVVSYMHHGIRIFETQRWAQVRTINTYGLVGASSISPNGAYIAVSNLVSGFDVYTLDDGKLASSFDQDIVEAVPIPVIWVHGGRAILAGTTVGKMRVWYFNSGHKRFSLTPCGEKVLAISAYYDDTADEFFIACGSQSASQNSSLIIWKAEEEGHESSSPDDDEEVEELSSDPDTQIGPLRNTFSPWNWYFGILAVSSAVFMALWIAAINAREGSLSPSAY